MKFDAGVRYAESHEWARKQGDLIVVGISDFAQDSLGDVVFVELPAVGKTIEQGAAFGVVESVKAASDVYAPVAGEVVEINADLSTEPALINTDPFGAGWMIKLRPSHHRDYDTLLDAAAYEAKTKA